MEEFPYNLINDRKKKSGFGKPNFGGYRNHNLIAIYVMTAIIILLVEFCFITQVGSIVEDQNAISNVEASIISGPKVLTFLDELTGYDEKEGM